MCQLKLIKNTTLPTFSTDFNFVYMIMGPIDTPQMSVRIRNETPGFGYGIYLYM